ncbi:MAG: tetratricopeptide repeat protein [Gemmatimonadota bacterium]
MKKVINEVHRRSLWQVLGLYLAAAWMVLQVVDVIGNNFGLPDWVPPAALSLLLVGLPIVLATAFVQEGMSSGGKADAPSQTLTEEAPPGPSAAASPGSSSAASPGARRLFTWKKALLGGAAAFAALVAVAGAWLVLRSAGIGPMGTLVASGALEERALVILSDFEADEATLSDAATEALRVDLSQSDIIRLADPALIAEALERMGRDPAELLTTELATELAVREGAGAVIFGEINRAGSGHLFSAQVVSAVDGAVLTSQRESAADDADVIPAIDRLSKKLRERMGDSYKSIRSDPPLARVTTSSLEALKLYSRSADAGGARQVALLEQALALDSTFAMAWRALGIAYRNNLTDRAAMVDALTRAFEHRDRLTETERRKAASMYYTAVDFEPRLAAAEYQALLVEDPDDYGSVINLGVLMSAVGDHEASAEQALKAVALEPERGGPGYWNAITELVNAGRIDEAEAMADSAVKVWGNESARARAMVLVAQGRLDEAEANFREILEQDLRPGWRAGLALRLAQFAAARGRVSEAEEETRIRTAFLVDEGITTEYYETLVQAAWMDVVVRQRPAEAVGRLEGALGRHPLADLQPRDRPYLELAEVTARAGRPDMARGLVAEMREHFEDSDLKRLRSELWRAEGEIALAEGRPEEAKENFRRAFEAFCHICPLPGLALAYEAAGQPDSAIAAHTRYVETPYSDRFLPYAYPLGQALAPTHERLGDLLYEAGELDEAARHYARFIELWSEADEELQPRVRAVRERLERTLRQRG